MRDTEVAGFFVLIGKRRKSFMAQGEFWRDGVREFAAQVKLGEFGDLSTREARSKAKDALGSIARGQRPGESPRSISGSVTLRQAWERYRDAHMRRKGRNAGTIENYRDHMERLFANWLDKPLARLSRQPNLVLERHEKITEENGPYIANGSMRSLRAVYNHARKSNADLPPMNPVTAIDWNKERRRNTGMGMNDVGGWFKELDALPKSAAPGVSSSDATQRITAYGAEEHSHRAYRPVAEASEYPKTQGRRGESIRHSPVATDDPLHHPGHQIGRILYPEQAKIWLFPAESETGHLVEHKEERGVLSKWGNDLRQSYRTLAQAAGVSELDVHLLMNHSLPGVNAGYITRDKLLRDHLRKQQERVSAIVTERARDRDGRPCLSWLVSAKVDTPVTEELKQAA